MTEVLSTIDRPDPVTTGEDSVLLTITSSSYSAAATGEKSETADEKQPAVQTCVPKRRPKKTKLLTASKIAFEEKYPSDPSAPKRPFSAYNLFFKVERQRLLDDSAINTSDGAEASSMNNGIGASEELSGSDDVVYTVADCDRAVSVSIEQHEQCCKDPHLHRRKHRKSHGKISFTDLARTIARKWKSLSPANKNMFEQYVAVNEKERYERQMIEWANAKRIIPTNDGRTKNETVVSRSIQDVRHGGTMNHILTNSTNGHCEKNPITSIMKDMNSSKMISSHHGALEHEIASVLLSAWTPQRFTAISSDNSLVQNANAVFSKTVSSSSATSSADDGIALEHQQVIPSAVAVTVVSPSNKSAKGINVMAVNLSSRSVDSNGDNSSLSSHSEQASLSPSGNATVNSMRVVKNSRNKKDKDKELYHTSLAPTTMTTAALAAGRSMSKPSPNIASSPCEYDPTISARINRHRQKRNEAVDTDTNHSAATSAVESQLLLEVHRRELMLHQQRERALKLHQQLQNPNLRYMMEQSGLLSSIDEQQEEESIVQRVSSSSNMAMNDGSKVAKHYVPRGHQDNDHTIHHDDFHQSVSSAAPSRTSMDHHRMYLNQLAAARSILLHREMMLKDNRSASYQLNHDAEYDCDPSFFQRELDYMQDYRRATNQKAVDLSLKRRRLTVNDDEEDGVENISHTSSEDVNDEIFMDDHPRLLKNVARIRRQLIGHASQSRPPRMTHGLPSEESIYSRYYRKQQQLRSSERRQNAEMTSTSSDSDCMPFETYDTNKMYEGKKRKQQEQDSFVLEAKGLDRRQLPVTKEPSVKSTGMTYIPVPSASVPKSQQDDCTNQRYSVSPQLTSAVADSIETGHGELLSHQKQPKSMEAMMASMPTDQRAILEAAIKNGGMVLFFPPPSATTSATSSENDSNQD